MPLLAYNEWVSGAGLCALITLLFGLLFNLHLPYGATRRDKFANVGLCFAAAVIVSILAVKFLFNG